MLLLMDSLMYLELIIQNVTLHLVDTDVAILMQSWIFNCELITNVVTLWQNQILVYVIKFTISICGLLM